MNQMKSFLLKTFQLSIELDVPSSIDPFGEHNRTQELADKNIPLDPVTPGGPKGTPHSTGSSWEPEHEQETSFRGRSAPLRGGTSRTSALRRNL